MRRELKSCGQVCIARAMDSLYKNNNARGSIVLLEKDDPGRLSRASLLFGCKNPTTYKRKSMLEPITGAYLMKDFVVGTDATVCISYNKTSHPKKDTKDMT